MSNNAYMFIATEPLGPVWSQTGSDGKLQNQNDAWHSWLASNYVWIPSYIAYGLVDMVPWQDTVAPIADISLKPCQSQMSPSKGKGIKGMESSKRHEGKNSLAPDEQEFHQDMLRKLALHLAAQPDAEADSDATVQEQHVLEEPEKLERQEEHSPECISHFCECANFFKHVDKQDEASDAPDTPRSFCATPEEHGMPVWAGKHQPPQPPPHMEYMEDLTERSSHCVCVPSYIVHGLLETVALGEGKGRERRLGAHDQEFHQQMLRKLALHLAAQPGSDLSTGSYPAHAPQSPALEKSRAGRRGQHQQGKGFFQHDSRPQQEEFHRQMLQKLALHLAAQPDTPTPSPHASQYVAPMSMSPAAAEAHAVPAPAPEVRKAPSPSFSQGHQSHPALQPECNQELLRKLALHLAAQDHPLDKPHLEVQGDGIKWQPMNDPAAIGEDKASCDRLIAELEGNDRDEHLNWVLSVVRPFSSTQFGSRVVQKAIATASVQEKEKFAQELLSHSMDLYVSPHGNHVLAKLIEVLPSSRLVCIAESMKGQAATVARHQFGSRILERLLEHCSEQQIGFLLNELLDDLEALARHAFANFVVQHLFEHGTPERKTLCLQKLLPHVLQHATHKTASNVVQRMLEHADVSSQALIADAFLAGEGEASLETIAATRYGSFVIHSLVDKLHPRIDAVKERVKAAHPQLQESKFSQKNILDFLGEAFFRE